MSTSRRCPVKRRPRRRAALPKRRRAPSSRCIRRALILGSDQVADVDGAALGKPGAHHAAVAQLTALSGRIVVFHTAVALLDAESGRCALREVDVTTRFRELAPAAIEDYLRRDRPYDCAASIKSEALGIALVSSIESDDPTALIGLPLIAVVDLLGAAGVTVLDTRAGKRHAIRGSDRAR